VRVSADFDSTANHQTPGWYLTGIQITGKYSAVPRWKYVEPEIVVPACNCLGIVLSWVIVDVVKNGTATRQAFCPCLE